MTALLTSLLCTILIALPVFAGGGDEENREGDVPLVDIEALVPTEEGLIQIEVAGIASHDFHARFASDTLFVPYITLCDFLRIRNEVSPDYATMRGELTGGEKFEISRRTTSATAGGETMIFSPASIRVKDGEIYIEQGLLLKLLGVSGNFDLEKLKLRINPDATIPLVQWHRKQGEYASLGRDINLHQVHAGVAVNRLLLGGSVLNWSLANSMQAGTSSTMGGSLRVGAEFLYGVVELGGSGSLLAGDSLQTDGSLDIVKWTYYLPSSNLIRRLTAGTITVADRHAYGVELSNEPIAPRIDFTSYTLTGHTQPGWTVELYDGNHLVDVTQGDDEGEYLFRIPVGYGTTDRTIRQLGPTGEIITETRRIEPGAEMIPGGEIEYNASLGVERLDSLSAASGQLRVGVGLWDQLTIGGRGTIHAHDMKSWSLDSIQPSVYATLWLGGSSSLRSGYDFVSDMLGGEFRTISADNIALRLGIDSLSLSRGSFVVSAATTVPFGPLSIGGSTRYQRLEGGNCLEVEPRISGYAAGLSFEGSVKLWRTLSNPTYSYLPNEGKTASLRVLGTPFSGILVTAGAQYDIQRNSLADLNLETYFRLNTFLGLSVGYSIRDLNWSDGILRAQLSLDLTPARISMVGNYHKQQVHTASFAQGGMILSGNGIVASYDISVGQAAVIVTAFHDRNLNGFRDPDEESLSAPDARLFIGRTELQTDNAVFRSIPPNRECLVEVDRWSLGDQGLFPSRTKFTLYTSVSGIHEIEVPFAEGIDLSGSCRVHLGNDSSGTDLSTPLLTGLRVKLVRSANDAEYEGEVFSDGTIYIPAVAAGTYQLSFDSLQLQSRRLCHLSSPGAITVTPTNTVLPTLTLTRCNTDRTIPAGGSKDDKAGEKNHE